MQNYWLDIFLKKIPSYIILYQLNSGIVESISAIIENANEDMISVKHVFSFPISFSILFFQLSMQCLRRFLYGIGISDLNDALQAELKDDASKRLISCGGAKKLKKVYFSHLNGNQS